MLVRGTGIPERCGEVWRETVCPSVELALKVAERSATFVA